MSAEQRSGSQGSKRPAVPAPKPPARPPSPTRPASPVGAKRPAAPVVVRAAATPARAPEAARDEGLRQARLWIAVGLGAVLLVSLIFGGLVLKVVVAIVCLTALQGLWRGASGLAGLVAGLALAALLAPTLGRWTEGLVASVAGTSGIANRFASIGVSALLVVVATSIGAGFGVRRLVKARPGWKRWDPIAGAAFGAAEGVFLALLLLWAPLALEPIARSQMESAAGASGTPAPSRIATADHDLAPEAPAPAGNAVSTGVVSFATRVRESVVGGLAQATNPIRGSRVLTLASDFVAVSADPGAIDHFRNSDVIRRIADMPSVLAALDMCRADPDLRRIVEGGRMSHASLADIMQNETILRILDETTIVDDLTPLAPAIAEAIVSAKARVGEAPARSEDPPAREPILRETP